MTKDEEEIRNLISTWMSATKAGDYETVLGLIADDAQFLVAGHAPFGKDAYEAASKNQDAASIKFEGESRILEIDITGDRAFLMTHLTVKTRQPGSKNTVHAGNTLSVLVKRDGKWLLYRDANLLVPVSAKAK